MISRLRLLFITLLPLFCLEVSGQFYKTGSDPARLKWLEVNSDNYRLIYPEGSDSLAQRYLFLLEKHRNNILKPLNIDPKKIPVILHSHTTYSNGVVVWTPKRVEIFTSPPAYQGYSEDWATQLVLHETRHIGQTSHFTKGVFKYLGILIGEQSPGIGVGLYPSTWFLESDAVIAESELGKSGRARSAEFQMYHRAAFLNGEYRSWDKWRYGSYKYYTPDIYSFGYLIASTIRHETHNPLYPGELLNSFVRHFYTPLVDKIGYKEVTGATKYQHFNKAKEIMTDIWRKDYENRGKFTDGEKIKTNRSGYYFEYRSPIKNNNKIIAVKSGFEQASHLIVLDTSGKEKNLRPFPSQRSKLELFGDMIYWSETVPSLRWEHETYSDIFSYDINKNKLKRLTSRSKYFNPAVSNDGEKIVVAEYPPEGGSNIVLIDIRTGEVLDKIKAPEDGQIRESVFAGDNLFCTVITLNGIGLYLYSEGKWSVSIPDQAQTIQFLRSAGDILYFVSDLDGVNNIYSYNPESNQFLRVTNSRYGAFDPYFDTGTNMLYFSEFDIKGYHPAKLSLDTLQYKSMDFGNPHKYPMAEMLSEQANSYIEPNDGFQLKDSDFLPKRFGKLSNLFHIHSWAPLYYNVDDIMNMSYENWYDIASPGAVIYSQNLLGTATTMVGYSYHNGRHAGHFKFTYTGLYPVFEVKADYNDEYSYGTSKPEPLLSGYIRTYVPINLNRNGWNRGLIPQLSWSFSNNLTVGARYYQMRPVSKASIYPKWGYSFSAYYTPILADQLNKKLYLTSFFYTPGFIAKHGIKWSISYQRTLEKYKKTNYYISFISPPRGFTYKDPSTNVFLGSIDYAFPVYLNDISISVLAYLQRLQVIPFVDIQQNRGSVGCDVKLDAYFFHLGVPVSIGFRYAYKSRKESENDNRSFIGLLFNISLPN